MPSVSIEEGLTELNPNAKAAHWPATFVAMLLARSFGLAAGVALMFLLAAALLSVR